ncbi:MAG: hypothetical protein HYV97_14480 [Bdellovibrio sp.]|nr:hypothetical protein [Bdellovibrio sp.]
MTQAPLAQETCSRTVLINHQEVLIDNNSTQKGEGLRYHIEKDPIAKSYLDTYQEGTRTRLETTILGTIGSSLIFAGILSNSSSGDNTRLIFGGISVLMINFLITRTLDYQNEDNLMKSINEYNKRNLPKIQFTPEARNENTNEIAGIRIGLAKTWSF